MFFSMNGGWEWMDIMVMGIVMWIHRDAKVIFMLNELKFQLAMVD